MPVVKMKRTFILCEYPIQATIYCTERGITNGKRITHHCSLYGCNPEDVELIILGRPKEEARIKWEAYLRGIPTEIIR